MPAVATAADALNLDSAIQLAFAKNPGLDAIRISADAARGRLEQAGLRANPNLEAGVQSDLLTGNTGARQFELGVTQDLPRGGQIADRQAVAQIDIADAEAELDDRERLIAGEITSAFVDLLAFDRQISLRDSRISAARELLDLSRNRAAAGELSSIEVNAATLDLAKLTQERGQLVADRADRLERLKPLLGLNPDDSLETAGNFDDLLSAIGANADGDPASWDRPDLRRAQLAIDQIDAESRLARSSARGDLTVGASYTFERGPAGDSDHKLGVQFALPLPLRNRNQGTLRELEAKRSAASRQAEMLQLQVKSEVAAARKHADALKALSDANQEDILAPRASFDRDLESAFQQGQISFFQVIQAEQDRLELESQAQDVLTEYAKALVELQTATGRNPAFRSSQSSNASP